MGAIQKWDEYRTMPVELSIDGWDINPKKWERFLEVQDLTNENQLPAEIAMVLYGALYRDRLCGDEIFDEEPAELQIEFRSVGYYDPGCTYGPPENCYPPEGDDERTMYEVRFVYGCGDDAANIPLTEKEQQQIFDYYQDRVDEEELD